MTTLCDCGHAPSPHSSYTTGYGMDAKDRTFCYSCCADRARAAMVETGRSVLYLASEENVCEVTDWPGTLRFRVREVRRSRNNFGAPRVDVWFAGPDGYLWHGVNLGDNDLCRVRRTKTRA